MSGELERGVAAAKGGRSAEAFALLEDAADRAGSAGDVATAADALDWLGWLAWVELDGARAARYADAILRLNLPKTSREAFRIYIGQATATLQAGDAVRAAELLDEAENAGELADIDAFAAYLMLKGDVSAALGEHEQSIHHLQLAVEISRKRRDPYALWRQLLYFGYALQAAGRVRAAMIAHEEALALANARGLTWERTLSLSRAALGAYTLGDMTRAREYLRLAFESPEPHRWAYVQRSFTGLAVAVATGDEELLALAFDESVPSSIFESADAYTIGHAAAAYHAYFRRVERDEDAENLLRRAFERLPSPDCGWGLIEAAAEYGTPDQIVRADALLSTFPKTHPLAAAYRALFDARVALRRGDRSDCERRAGEAQAFFEHNEWLFMAARAAELGGRLGDAKNRYAAMGATAETRRLTGLRARPGRPRGGYESTQQRRRIVELIATGATNRTIAEHLGVSSRTVKYRISELYAAEGVASREEFLAVIRSGRLVT
jgi:tetratricopeptide (TPR) repeat protein/DNA-binding CsgD family transcriptional regulator